MRIPTGRSLRMCARSFPTADRQKATVKVRISFDKLDPRILPDMGVKVAFMGEEEAKKKTRRKTTVPKPISLIPKSAVRDGRREVRTCFWCRTTKLERRGVTLGKDRGSDVEMMAGVNCRRFAGSARPGQFAGRRCD